MPHIRDFKPVLPDPQPYTEKALALYDRTVRDKRGRVVFIAAREAGACGYVQKENLLELRQLLIEEGR